MAENESFEVETTSSVVSGNSRGCFEIPKRKRMISNRLYTNRGTQSNSVILHD